MKTIISFLLIIFNISFLFSQENNAPEVTNVTFSQRDDASFMVDVFYDVNDADGDTMSIIMQVSDDAGATWNFSCSNITGDVGSNILSGTAKHILWDFGVEHPQTTGDQFQVKIIANDNFFEAGTLIDIDGNVYKTVKIGEQWWMAENLKVTHYCNGETIPYVTDYSVWNGLTSGAYRIQTDGSADVETYGLLYNWYAGADSRSIAPEGWHTPSKKEYQTLVDYLGGVYVAGGKLKEAGTEHWVSPNTGATNESGFTALPGGWGGWYLCGYEALFWSVTDWEAKGAWIHLEYYNSIALL